MRNISMTYYTSFCISRLCPLLYIAACATGINHFPASLLHEMKEFIMVTVGHCEAFTVIYLGEIDWFINTEWTVLLLWGQRCVPCCVSLSLCVLGEHILWRFRLGVPCKSMRGLLHCKLSSLTGKYGQWPRAGSHYFVAKNAAFLISSPICLPTW